MTTRKFATIALTAMLFLPLCSALLLAGDHPNSLKRGSWALQFGISDNFTLKSFEGAMISAKRHLSDNSAVRFGISISGETGDTNVESSTTDSNSSDSNSSISTRDGDSSNFSFAVTSQLMFYTPTPSPMNLYIGIGPRFEYKRQKSEADTETTQDNANDGTLKDNSYSRSWGLGFQSVWGVECFVMEKLSLFAEYGAGVEYVSTHSERSQTTNTEIQSRAREDISESSKVRLYSAKVNFGLSLYFN